MHDFLSKYLIACSAFLVIIIELQIHRQCLPLRIALFVNIDGHDTETLLRNSRWGLYQLQLFIYCICMSLIIFEKVDLCKYVFINKFGNYI